MGIKDTRPVFGFEVGLVVNINLYLNSLSLSLDGVSGDSDGVEDSSNKLSKSSWAPVYNLSSLKAELGSKDRVSDGSVITDLTEGKGLVDRRALISEGVNSSLGVNGDTDGKSTGNSRGGRSRGRKVIGGDAWNVLKLGSSLGGGKGGGNRSLSGGGEGSGRADENSSDNRLHF